MNRDDYVPQRLPRVYNCFAADEDIELVLQIANFDHKWGGLTNNIYIGNPEQISGYTDYLKSTAAVICGAILIMAFYHLFVFLNRRNSSAPLFLSLFCFTVVFCYLFLVDYMIFQLFPWLPLFFTVGLYFLLLFLTIPLFMLFSNAVYPDLINRRLLYAVYIFSAALCVTSIFISMNLLSLVMLQLFYAIAVIVFVIIVIMLAMAVKQRRDGSLLSLAGFIVFFIASVYDILSNLKLIVGSPYGPFMPAGLLIFILMQAFILARQFTGAYGRLDELLENLEKMLGERTKQLAAANREVAEYEKLAAIGTMVAG